MPHSIVIPFTNTTLNYDLTTVEEVNEALDIESSTATDAETANQITNYSKLIGELCDRIFAQQTVVETFMLHESYIHGLTLKNYPVSEIISVTINGTALSASEYKVEPDTGLLWRWSGNGCLGWLPGEIAVTYTAGYDLPSEAPASLARACIEWIDAAAQISSISGISGGSLVRDIQHGDRRVSFFDASASASKRNASVPAVVDDLLRPFKRIAV